MDLDKFLQNIIYDVKVDLADEFDRNFERKAFFDEKWQHTKLHNRIGSLMIRRGNLRNSINADIQGNKIIFSSSLPYASIHNEGGELTVTTKMKKYFWAKHIEAKNTKNIIEAEQFKTMALKPIGSKIIIPKRQFIGNHPKVKEAVERAVNANLEELNKAIKQALSNK